MIWPTSVTSESSASDPALAFAYGKHFPAMESPADLAAGLRAFFGPRR